MSSRLTPFTLRITLEGSDQSHLKLISTYSLSDLRAISGDGERDRGADELEAGGCARGEARG
eukprot:6184541-Pleurochrysis_carterae.AAC.2